MAESSSDQESLYTVGSFSGDWYHGTLSRPRAEHLLAAMGCDSFLVRHSRSSSTSSLTGQGDLVLSFTHRGTFCHIIIKYRPGDGGCRYWLHGSTHEKFGELSELVSYYQEMPISESPRITLGVPCETDGTAPPGEH